MNVNFTLFRIGFLTFGLIDLLDILLVSYIFYKLYLITRRTRAVQMFLGLVLIFAVSFATQTLNMQEMSWIFKNLSTVWLVAFIILFQPELRRVLTIMGQNRVVRLFTKGQTSRMVEEIVKATVELAQRNHGGLIVIARDTGLKTIVETGIRMQSIVSSQLLVSIFNPKSPLHDGAVVIQNDILEAAKCILPLSRTDHPLGTRHRAALGISEESDALVVVVSEESGAISVVENGDMVRGLDREGLIENLSRGLNTAKQKSAAAAESPSEPKPSKRIKK
jgi:diadenylate cyclase